LIPCYSHVETQTMLATKQHFAERSEPCAIAKKKEGVRISLPLHPQFQELITA
jgi:hypothetical protein